MRPGLDKVTALDLARLIDQNVQRFAGAVEALVKQSGECILQGIVFHTLCHVDS